MADKTGEILAERGSTYGDFTDQSRIEQTLMDTLMAEPGWQGLQPFERSAMQMICVKMARVVNGKPHEDNYRDMSGYATLAADRVAGGVGR